MKKLRKESLPGTEGFNQLLIKTTLTIVFSFLLVFLGWGDPIPEKGVAVEKYNATELGLQQKAIKGKVTSEKGEPIPGVTVVVKGTNNGTITDIDGNFSFSGLAPDAVLAFTFIGLKTQEISVQGKEMLDVVLQEDRLALDEVIVIGYGTAKRQEYTGSVSSVKMENSPVALLPNLNAFESLKGNVAGLNIGASNSAGDQFSVIIRGQNSISGSNDPFIVLDGVIYPGSLSDINPNDIASFDILKDAVSVAIYGSRSANGVIAITTKKGRLGKPVITLNTSYGVQSWQNQPVMMKGTEWIEVVNARNQYSPGTTSWMKTGELANLAAGTETVWLDEVTQTGVIQDYQLAVSGGAENLNYYMSASYNNNKGIIVGDSFDRISVFGKLRSNITKWLEIGVDGSFSKRDYSGIPANVGQAQTMSPYGVMFRDAEGKLLEKYPYTQSAVNPLWGVHDDTRDNQDIRNNYRLNSYALVSLPWVKGLTYRLNYVVSQDANQSGNFYYETNYIKEGEGLARYEPSVVAAFLTQANGNIDNNKTYSYVVDNILNYKQLFGKHGVDATLVATRDYRRYEQVNSTGSDFASNGNTTLGMWGIHKATVQKVILNSDERANIGYLGRLNYSFGDKYYLSTSFRRDGASVFGANKKWGNFASTGLA